MTELADIKEGNCFAYLTAERMDRAKEGPKEMVHAQRIKSFGFRTLHVQIDLGNADTGVGEDGGHVPGRGETTEGRGLVFL